MLYHFFEYIEKYYNLPGARLFQYITFRAAFAIILSLTISLIFGGRIIKILKNMQIGETVRELGLDGQKAKEGTPTMGGIIIIMAILIPSAPAASLIALAKSRATWNIRAAVASGSSKMSRCGSFGITRLWPGWFGKASRNAKTRSSSYSFRWGTSPAIIL